MATALAALPLLPAPAPAQGMAWDGRLRVGAVQMQLWPGSSERERERERIHRFTVHLRNMSAQSMGVQLNVRSQGVPTTGAVREVDITAGASTTLTLLRLPTFSTLPSTTTVQGWLRFVCH